MYGWNKHIFSSFSRPVPFTTLESERLNFKFLNLNKVKLIKFSFLLVLKVKILILE